MTIEIESDVPMPLTKKKSKYPWGEMEKGDSFATEKHVSTTAANKRLAPRKFKCLPFEGAFRVWRVE